MRDSGGPGRYSGGLGPRRQWEILVDDAQLTCRGSKHTIPPAGVDSGLPRRAPGRWCSTPIRRRGDECCCRAASAVSGSCAATGYAFNAPAARKLHGNPHARPVRSSIVSDVLDGYVSRESAVRDYGADAVKLDAAICRVGRDAGARAMSVKQLERSSCHRDFRHRPEIRVEGREQSQRAATAVHLRRSATELSVGRVCDQSVRPREHRAHRYRGRAARTRCQGGPHRRRHRRRADMGV